jgi:hypothetical protein
MPCISGSHAFLQILAESGVRPGGEQPQIVGDFQQVDGQGAEDSADLDEGVGILRGLDQVFGPCQSEAGDLRSITSAAGKDSR